MLQISVKMLQSANLLILLMNWYGLNGQEHLILYNREFTFYNIYFSYI